MQENMTLTSSSELHGMFCSYICAKHLAKNKTQFLRTLEGLSQSQQSSVKEKRDLEKRFELNQSQLEEADFAFQLLLPDDKTALSERLQALGEWCLGFGNGIKLLEVDLSDEKLTEVQDAILYFAEIANIDYNSAEENEDSERDYMELVEYIRMAVIMIKCDMKNG